MRFGIASYQRIDKLHSLKTLKDMGYGKDEIIVATQTEDDYKAYSSEFGKAATIIYRYGTNVGVNRNTVLNYMNPGEELFFIDDDVRAFERLVEIEGKKSLRVIGTRAELEAIASRQFAFCRKANSPWFAWYPTENAFFMSKTVHTRNIFCATVLGVVNHPDIRFDERYTLKEDYDISLRLIEEGYNAVRFNGYTAKASHYVRGGCWEARENGQERVRCRNLLERYPGLVQPHATRENEVKYVGPTKKLAYE